MKIAGITRSYAERADTISTDVPDGFRGTNFLFKIFNSAPDGIKAIFRPLSNTFLGKYRRELLYWKSKYIAENKNFSNSHYSEIMLAMAEEPNESFLTGKIVADFGCGPRGSLAWCKPALLRIGIDVLADRYADEFTCSIMSHGIMYLKSSENVIPLPSNFVDVMFTLNAMDHVDHFPGMCNEIIRVIKPGGVFIGSFNLEEPPTRCEPQQLDEKTIHENLLSKLKILSYRISNKGPEENIYASFLEGNPCYEKGREGCLWVKAKKSESGC